MDFLLIKSCVAKEIAYAIKLECGRYAVIADNLGIAPPPK